MPGFIGTPLGMMGSAALHEDYGRTAMDDRELLELAARATSGFELVPDMGWIAVDAEGNRGSWWDPLGDDGDALRLLIALLRHGSGVHLDVYKGTVKARFHPTSGREPGVEGWCWTKHAARGAADVYELDEAARRAIVRAAAEIGKGLVTPTPR